MELKWIGTGFLFLITLATELLPSTRAVPVFTEGCPPGTQQRYDKCKSKTPVLLEINKQTRNCKDLSAGFNKRFDCVIDAAVQCENPSLYQDSYLSLYNKALSRVDCPLLLIQQRAVPNQAIKAQRAKIGISVFMGVLATKYYTILN